MTATDVDDLTARFCDGLGKTRDLAQILSAADTLIFAMAQVCRQPQEAHPSE
jgi:hypothetical protein